MTENHAVGLMTLLVTLPGWAWAWSDYREGTVRLILFSRRRSSALATRKSDPARFRAYIAFNTLLLALLMFGGIILMVKS